MENGASSPIFLQVIDKFMRPRLFECIEENQGLDVFNFLHFKISFNSRIKAV